jgi:hydroxyacylglutathione hydrolase
VAALSAASLRCVAILVTHAHFDHVGAVAPLARSLGCPVYISSGEAPILAELHSATPAGIGPFESYEADVKLQGDERFSLAGLDFQTHLVPGHSVAGLAFEVRDPESGQAAILVGDVLFRGSVGRTDFPGGSAAVLDDSIVSLYETCPRDAPVLSGHSEPTTLALELDTNPFLDRVRQRVAR